jgi:hypothetical protein
LEITQTGDEVLEVQGGWEDQDLPPALFSARTIAPAILP